MSSDPKIDPTAVYSLPPPQPITAFVGNFGSGKTETALAYALALAHAGRAVQLVDLDLVNPYFRSREVRAYAAEQGVEVVAPEESLSLADLPILLRQVRGSMTGGPGNVILDVGGDDLGARILGGFADALPSTKAAVLQVVNERRPFTDSLAGARQMYDELEAAARLQITGLVANSHLMGETTVAVIEDGLRFAQRMAAEVGVPVQFMAVEQSLAQSIADRNLGCPILAIERLMTAPWEKSTRRGPIGRPPKTSLPTNVK